MSLFLLILSEIEFLGVELFDKQDFIKLLVKSAFNFLVVGYIVRYIYYATSKNKDYLFTYILISITVFFLCFLLENVKLELGFALGLFAIFGILRYRTEQLPIKEMTYLFIVIGLAMINALANKSISMAELFFTNFVIVGTTLGIETIWFNDHERSKIIVYEKIGLIKPENEVELLNDLRERTGLDVFKFSIGKIDFLKDVASIKIYYKEKK